LQKDVLAQIDFTPVIADDLKTMDAAIFKPEKMLTNNPDIFPRFPKKTKKH
jgi:acyl CoA:acetate/3-ketoacid CoA transferase